MGNTLWIEVRGRPVKETHQDCTISHRAADLLDALSSRLSVGPFSRFFDYTELATAYADLIAEVGGPASEPNWSDAGAGLRVVTALLDRITSEPTALGVEPGSGRDHWPGRLVEELTFFRTVLERAVADDQAFRLLIVP